MRTQSLDSRRSYSKTVSILLGIFICVYVLGYGTLAVYQHNHFSSHLFDLALQDQVVWNTAQGRWFQSSIETSNYLGDHFQPLMGALAAFYIIYPSVYWLLIFQTVVLALGAVPVYRLASRRLRSPVAGLVFAVAYLAFPSVGHVNRFDFHWEATVIPLFLAAADAADAGKLRWSSAYLALAILGKEEMGLTAAAFGLRSMGKGRARFAVTWVVVGVVVSLLALFVMIPAIRGEPSDTLLRYQWLGSDAGEMLRTIWTRPGYVLGNIVWADVGRYFLHLFTPLLFLPLAAPINLVPIVPSAVYNLLSGSYPQRTVFYQYVAPTVPFVFVGAIYGAEAVRQKLQRLGKARLWWLVMGALLAVTPLSFWRTSPLLNPDNWARLENEAAVREALQYVPAEASVTTTDPYAPHLSHRETVCDFTSLDTLCGTDVIFLNLKDYRPLFAGDYTYSDADYALALDKAEECGFEVVFSADGAVVLQRSE